MVKKAACNRFLKAVGKYSQVNENGPVTMILGTKATIHLSHDSEGAPAR
jgi:hypothetical protein